MGELEYSNDDDSSDEGSPSKRKGERTKDDELTQLEKTIINIYEGKKPWWCKKVESCGWTTMLSSWFHSSVKEVHTHLELAGRKLKESKVRKTLLKYLKSNEIK